MKKMLELGVWMALLLGGVSQAETLVKMKAWSDKLEPGPRVEALARFGIENPAAVEAITAEWDEAVVVNAALQVNAIRFLETVAGKDGLSVESQQKIRVHQEAQNMPDKFLWGLVLDLPVTERAAFEPLLRKMIPVRYGSDQLQGEMELKYRVLQGKYRVVGSHTETEDLVALLLHTTALDMRKAQDLKAALKARAVLLAKRKLRSEGKSFVATDDVNPLAELVKPVTDALNQPACAGLEVALRQLGAEVPDVDRAELLRRAGAWRERILLGDMTAKRTNEVIGRLSIGLGVDAFNVFVEVYNHGDTASTP